MTSTPPLQITAEARTPPTPLHGSAYHGDSPSLRYNTRSSVRKAERMSRESPGPLGRSNISSRTPGSSQFASQTSPKSLHSPQSTPKQRPTRRVHVIAPPSPDLGSPVPSRAAPPKSLSSSYLSSTTTLSDGMLPTPVKTPKRKTVQNSGAGGRALFQDQIQTPEFAPSPRKARKMKRHNGFSLESFSAEDGSAQNNIQIFTDSRDQVPEADNTEDNPFVDQPEHAASASVQRMPGNAKRRKVTNGRKVDAQVQDAIEKDEGMVYVFRGKKIYRRFDDQGDEEEDIDVDDAGLLEHTSNGTTMTGPFKTLTRKTIKPRRLFETEAQKKAREQQNDEEADTEIEDEVPAIAKTSKRGKQISDTVKGGNDVIETRTEGQDGTPVSKAEKRGKKTSPFDSWRRIKPGSASSSTPKTQARKRTAAEALDDSDVRQSVKLSKSN